MKCEECGQEAAGRAMGWEAHLIDMDDDGQDDLVFFSARPVLPGSSTVSHRPTATGQRLASDRGPGSRPFSS